MATMVDLSHFSLAQLNGQPRKHPTEKESLTHYLCCKPCCSQFCVYICHISLLCQQGLV